MRLPSGPLGCTVARSGSGGAELVHVIGTAWCVHCGRDSPAHMRVQGAAGEPALAMAGDEVPVCASADPGDRPFRTRAISDSRLVAQAISGADQVALVVGLRCDQPTQECVCSVRTVPRGKGP